MDQEPSEQRYDPAVEVVGICQDLIGIDTSNYGDSSGPGERKAAEYVAAQLQEVGIEADIIEAAPGRANVVARWGDHSGGQPPLLVHGHLDVVPARADDWTLPPFAAEISDDYLYGRGAVDMKDFDAMVLSTVRARQRAGVPPKRPVVLVFTADEEAGSGYGGHYLVDHHADLLADCTEAIGEVGGFSADIAGQRLYVIESGEKGLAWMRLTAEGAAGHGSMRHPDNAVTAIAAAVAAIGAYEWPVEPGPSMRQLLAKVSELTGIDGERTDDLLAAFGPAARMIGAGLCNTTNPTMLSAGYKVNVVPGSADAHVDGRYLPGDADTFVDQVRAIAGDHITVEAQSFQPALEIGFEGDLVDAMTAALHAEDPDAHIAPFLMSGGTDAKAWARLGIRSYGFTPLRLPADLDFTALFHGVDERVPLDALAFGARVFDRLVDLA